MARITESGAELLAQSCFLNHLFSPGAYPTQLPAYWLGGSLQVLLLVALGACHHQAPISHPEEAYLWTSPEGRPSSVGLPWDYPSASIHDPPPTRPISWPRIWPTVGRFSAKVQWIFKSTNTPLNQEEHPKETVSS